MPGLGTQFRQEFDLAIARILETPDRWRILEKDIRRFLMRRFPYSILYRIEGVGVRILVVKQFLLLARTCLLSCRNLRHTWPWCLGAFRGT